MEIILNHKSFRTDRISVRGIDTEYTAAQWEALRYVCCEQLPGEDRSKLIAQTWEDKLHHSLLGWTGTVIGHDTQLQEVKWSDIIMLRVIEKFYKTIIAKVHVLGLCKGLFISVLP